MKVSIDMSTDDATAHHRIYGNIIEEITSRNGERVVFCEFDSANYDFCRKDEILKLKNLLKECRAIIHENILGEYVIELCERITNAIGEKK